MTSGQNKINTHNTHADISKPYISVIITAYNRKEFLIDAVKSAINQTLKREFFEVIVSKNFDDLAIDTFLRKNGIICMRFEECLSGEMLLSSALVAKGEVISFLDDDDLFTPDKLERVYDIFINNKNVCVHRNEIRYIDIGGNSARALYRVCKDDMLIRNSEKEFGIKHILKYSRLFNMSTISVLKAVVVSCDYLRFCEIGQCCRR